MSDVSESMDRELERIRTAYDRRGMRLAPSGGGTARRAREWVAARAHGDTLEIGIGAGRTIGLYGPDVRLTGVELSPVMLDHARREAALQRRDVALCLGDAMALEFAEASFDTVVFSFVLCTVPDDRRAIAEAARVLRPGGRFLAVEHVRSPNPIVRLVERAWEPMARRQADHMLRDPLDHLAGAGLTIETLERGWLGMLERVAAVRT